MEALLAAYSIEEILLFLVLLFGAIKEGVGAIQWIKEQYNIKFNSDYKQINESARLEEHYSKCFAQHQESVEMINKLEKNIDSTLGIIDARLDNMEKKIGILSESDRDDIKSWLVEKYNYYKENPNRPITHNTMDTIERRYAHYKEEGGNSYIDNDIMPELRKMAKEEQRVEL